VSSCWIVLLIGRSTLCPCLRNRHHLNKPEEIVAKLRQVDVLVSQGKYVADAVRSIGMTEVTYYRWRQEFGGAEERSGEAIEESRGRERPASARCFGPDAG